MNFDKESKSDSFFAGGGGEGGGVVRAPSFDPNSYLNFLAQSYNHFLIFFCLISRSKVSLGDLHINPYHTLQRDSLDCPSSTILCYFQKWMQTSQVYSYLILNQFYARIILTQIWSKFIKRLLRYCHFHVLRHFQ